MSMFAMPQHQYVYATQVPAPRQYSTDHGTSSAFSPSANPDEDWTKIPDLAMRRRIQNRIAQRNYRKKLKRKLEELERRAGDGTAGPEKHETSQTKSKKHQVSQKSQKSAPGPKPLQPGQYTPPTQHDDILLMPSYDERERSHTPPMFHYPQYPPEALSVAQYGTTPYTAATGTETYPAYLAATDPVTLPSMTNCSDAIKRNVYDSSDGLAPYMNYGYIPDIDVSSPHQYETSNPHTPPLSHSFDHSANCSESGYDYPATPLSMPGSPGMTQH